MDNDKTNSGNRRIRHQSSCATQLTNNDVNCNCEPVEGEAAPAPQAATPASTAILLNNDEWSWLVKMCDVEIDDYETDGSMTGGYGAAKSLKAKLEANGAIGVSQAEAPRAATPPICKCGHERDAHEIEPPYYCNGWSMEHGGCECDGYTIPVRVSPKIDTTGFTDAQCRQVLAAIQLSRELGFRDGRSSVGQAEAPRPSAPTDKLLALVKASVHLAILRHDLGDDDMDIDAILEDTANAVRGIDTCAEEPIQEWTEVAESRPSAEEVEKMLIEEGWHISDGIDSCSGHDEQYMRESAKKIVEWMQERITRP